MAKTIFHALLLVVMVVISTMSLGIIAEEGVAFAPNYLSPIESFDLSGIFCISYLIHAFHSVDCEKNHSYFGDLWQTALHIPENTMVLRIWHGR